jgi:hypothetical protein
VHLDAKFLDGDEADDAQRPSKLLKKLELSEAEIRKIALHPDRMPEQVRHARTSIASVITYRAHSEPLPACFAGAPERDAARRSKRRTRPRADDVSITSPRAYHAESPINRRCGPRSAERSIAHRTREASPQQGCRGRDDTRVLPREDRRRAACVGDNSRRGGQRGRRSKRRGGFGAIAAATPAFTNAPAPAFAAPRAFGGYRG